MKKIETTINILSDIAIELMLSYTPQEICCIAKEISETIPTNKLASCFLESRKFVARPLGSHLLRSWTKTIQYEKQIVTAQKWEKTNVTNEELLKQQKILKNGIMQLMQRGVAIKPTESMLRKFNITKKEYVEFVKNNEVKK